MRGGSGPPDLPAGRILTLSIKTKRMKMPLATFEGSIRVGQERAVIAEEITLTFGYVDAVVPPSPAPKEPVPGVSQPQMGLEPPAGPAQRRAQRVGTRTRDPPPPLTGARRSSLMAPTQTAEGHYMARVFITGLGFVTSIGNDAQTVARNLRELRHGFELYPPFQKPDVPCKIVGTVKGFATDSTDPEDWTWPERYSIRRETLRSMAPHGLFAHCAVMQAVEDARLGPDELTDPSTGLYAASGGSPFLTHHHHARMQKVGVMRCSPLGIVSSIVGTLNFNLVAAFGIKGASCGFSSACASSAHAIGFAFDDISLGRQKRMLVVGAEDGNVDPSFPSPGCGRCRSRPIPAWPPGLSTPRATDLSATGGGVGRRARERGEAPGGVSAPMPRSWAGARPRTGTTWPFRIPRAPDCAWRCAGPAPERGRGR